MSRRTQITLTDRQHAFLVDESERTGLSLAELVRRAVDGVYRPYDRPRFAGLELSIGLWRRPDAALAARRLKAPPLLRRTHSGATPAPSRTPPRGRDDAA